MQDFIITQKNNIWWGMFPRLSQAGFGNACSCRLHGESNLVPRTLNLALHVGDDAELVLQNRRLFAQALGLDASKFTTCEQVHGSNVAVVDEALVGAGATTLADTIKDTDALVTNLANVPLLLFFADCVPLLFADERQGVLAWYGSTDWAQNCRSYAAILRLPSRRYRCCYRSFYRPMLLRGRRFCARQGCRLRAVLCSQSCNAR